MPIDAIEFALMVGDTDILGIPLRPSRLDFTMCQHGTHIPLWGKARTYCPLCEQEYREAAPALEAAARDRYLLRIGAQPMAPIPPYPIGGRLLLR